MNFGGYGGGMYMVGPPYFFCLLLKKTGKVQEHDLYLNQFCIILIFFPNMNNKSFTKRGPQGKATLAQLLFIYEVSKAILIHFTAILLTLASF